MKRYSSYITLLCLFIHFVLTECITIHKTNRVPTKNYQNSLHASMNIENEDNMNEINYFNPQKIKSYVNTEEIENDIESNNNNEKEFNENNLDENLIDEIDFNKMNVLNNKELLQNLKKTYNENDIENKKLIQHIKHILSKALHIPSKEINLHDINIIMKKWKIMNKNKQSINDINSNNKYHKDINSHEPKQTDTIDWEFTHGYNINNENINNNTISYNYLLDLIN